MTAEPLTPEEVLRQHAEGRIEHRLGGLCPDPVNGSETRDPDCEVCQALDAARKASPPLDVNRLRAELHSDPAFCGRYSPHGHPGWWQNPPCRQVAERLAAALDPTT